MLPNSKKPTIGDCEASHFDGKGVDVQITLTHGNMWLCDECLAKEAAVTSNKVVETSRKIDYSIEVKQDIFNAATVSFVELQAAFQNNPEIADDKKSAALAAETAARIDRMNTAIFAKEKSLIDDKNERHAWQVQLQNLTAKLHEKEREKYKQYDVNYKPITPKSVKPKVVKPSGKKFDKAALYEAARKYGVPASQVQVAATAHNMSYEDAAKYFAGVMGLL